MTQRTSKAFDGRSLQIPAAKSASNPSPEKMWPSSTISINRRACASFASAISLVDASVSTYQSRGFKHLMVSFSRQEAASGGEPA